ncbi:hypothetical protein [Mesorhizobium sp. ISC11]|uniref:hypothetical protein n=1 Tax=Mesorhizobium sp. ISC11 TaxID=3076428 RepID=UPI00301C90EE
MTMPRSLRRKGEAYEAFLPPGDQSRYFALAYSVRRVSQALNDIRQGYELRLTGFFGAFAGALADGASKKNPPVRRVTGANQHHRQKCSIAAVTESRKNSYREKLPAQRLPTPAELAVVKPFANLGSEPCYLAAGR